MQLCGAKSRRIAIAYQFQYVYGSPPEDKWIPIGIVRKIIKTFNIPKDSYNEVKEVLYEVVAAEDNGMHYNPDRKLCQRGRKPLIVADSPQAKIVYESLLLPEPEITTIRNEWRAGQQPALPALSPSAVHRFISNDDCIDRSRRITKKSGTDDIDSVWARARVAKCEQFLEMLRLGELPPECPDLQNNPLFLSN